MIYYEKKPNKSLGFIVICIFLIVIIYILVNLINKIDYNVPEVSKTETEEVTSFSSDEEMDIETLIENSMYSIVGISKIKENTTSSFSNNSENILGMGSGIVISQDGYILANAQVTGGLYSTCYVNLLNGTTYTGQVVWEDEELDISILKTNALSLPRMSFVDSRDCDLGERIYLISNYTGYEIQKTVEEGIISKVDNTFKIIKNEEEIYIEDVIKIDIEITKNNTGGAVINENGELIGIVSSLHNSVIPISRIENVLNQLLENGNCKKIDLGIYGFDNEIISYINSEMDIENGVYIEKVKDDGLLSNLISEGEIITRIDGIAVTKMSDIKEYVYKKKNNETIIISVIRDNIEKDIEIVI